MTDNHLSIREIEASDIEQIANYWTESPDEHLIGMGVDLDKIPAREDFVAMLTSQLSLPYNEKKALATIWLVDGEPVGHCNVNTITFGQEATMHLHLWQHSTRAKGIGTILGQESIDFFFEKLQLKSLLCEPYAQNPAPNKTLAKLGFVHEGNRITVPGSINFEQEVCSWRLTR